MLKSVLQESTLEVAQPKKIKGVAPLHKRTTVGDTHIVVVQLWSPDHGDLLSSVVIFQ